jgi:hypothetical protein
MLRTVGKLGFRSPMTISCCALTAPCLQISHANGADVLGQLGVLQVPAGVPGVRCFAVAKQ